MISEEEIGDYADYEPPTEAFLKMFCPQEYQARYGAPVMALAGSDPDAPPF